MKIYGRRLIEYGLFGLLIAFALLHAVKLKADQSGPVKIPDVSIKLRCPDCVLVGVSKTDVIEITLADTLKFHGYCPGVALSFREALEAFKALYGNNLPVRQQVKVYTAFHCCQAGALAYITGARTDFGVPPCRGDLVLIPEEMKCVMFIDKKTGKKVILIPLADCHKKFAPLFHKVRKDAGFVPQVQKEVNDAIHHYLFAPADKLFKIFIMEPEKRTTTNVIGGKIKTPVNK